MLIIKEKLSKIKQPFEELRLLQVGFRPAEAKYKVKRLFVEKRSGFDLESNSMCRELQNNLGIFSLKK